jgi:uncharacterized protein (TIGR03435 family)
MARPRKAARRQRRSGSMRAPMARLLLQGRVRLRLEARKGPLEVVVVDHANRVPLEN